MNDDKSNRNQEILNLADGNTLQDIATKFDISKERVRQILMEAGAPPRSASISRERRNRKVKVQRLLQKGRKLGHIAKKLNLSYQQVYSISVSLGYSGKINVYGATKWIKFRRLIEQDNYSVLKAAKKLNISRGRAQGYAAKHNIKSIFARNAGEQQ